MKHKEYINDTSSAILVPCQQKIPDKLAFYICAFQAVA